MKTPILSQIIVAALTLSVSSVAQDKTAAGKSGDAVQNLAPAVPGRPAEPSRTPGGVEAGKSSDAVQTPDPASAEQQFSGAITAINREEMTITVNDTTKGAHKLRIGESTRMKRGEKIATWEDLKLGAKVNGTSRGGPDKAYAEMINING